MLVCRFRRYCDLISLTPLCLAPSAIFIAGQSESIFGTFQLTLCGASRRDGSHRVDGEHCPHALLRAVVRDDMCFILFYDALYLSCRENLPGPSGSAMLQIMVLRIGKPGSLFLWVRLSSRGCHHETAVVDRSARFLSASRRFQCAKPACRRRHGRCTRLAAITVRVCLGLVVFAHATHIDCQQACLTGDTLVSSRRVRARRCVRCGSRRG